MPESQLDQEIKRVAEQIQQEKERKVQLEKEIKEKEDKLKEKLKSMASSSGVKKGVGKWRKQQMKTTSLWDSSCCTSSQECNIF